MDPALGIALCALALIVGAVLGRLFGPRPQGQAAELERQRLLEAARAEAEQTRRDALVQSKEMLLRAQEAIEAELKASRADMERRASRLTEQEEMLERKAAALTSHEEELNRRERALASREQQAEAAARKAEAAAAEALARLERTAGLTQEQARAQLAEEVREEARRAAAAEIKRIEEEARQQAAERANTILAAAIQRYASEYVAENTVSVVPLPSDDMKGRIIGREGRNIRALEAATGIDLIIDDTPEAVIISCFNPVRREIARLALTRLITDGRIHPTRIEEVVQRCTEEVEQQCKEAGEQAIFDLGIHKMHPELVRAVGRLKFRTSGGQNLLQHSIEVAWLAGAMAAELGLNVKLARRAGLLHDIGRTVDQEAEGSHAAAGAALCKKHGEQPRVCEAVAAHHGNGAARSILDHLVHAANLLSTQRPGARREVLESYIQRLHALEKLCSSFPGVERAYAIQAGREVRVFVQNDKVSDDQVALLSREIARRIEEEATYPGQIRVCVIRESRSTDYAR
ncbi:MAG: ribonuclease Y [Myxococcales bacterium]|nr:ribonuclease Y [Myxococcota bacterium]MDW8284257.1 ribonuclease Y [Myxococcales bacterium]